jgi:predicted ATPase
MRWGFAAQRAIGGHILEQYWLALQIEAHLQSRQHEQGLAVLTEAFAVAENGERIWEAEIYRLKGELTLQKQSDVQGPVSEVSESHSSDLQSQAEAEACFLKAIDIVRRQHAKSWKLRATVSLARLWRRQGKKKQAHKMLSEIYSWFTEGFDTKDLREAKALLMELSH